MADRTVKVILKADVSSLVNGMKSAQKSTKDFAKNSTDSVTNNRAEWEKVGTGMMVVGAAITGVGIAAAKTGIDYNTLQQTSRAALKTLLGSAQAANAQMDKLDAFARTSPFAKQVFITAQQQLIGFGMAAKDVIPTLDAIQNAVAATGGSNDDIAQLVRIIAQVGASGKITAEDLNQFGQRGVDAATLIGSQMGKTGAQIREEITKGTLGADDAVKALVTGMDQRFGGSAANVKATFAGATDRVKAAWRDLSGDLMAPLVGPNGGGFLIDVANGAANAMRAFQSLPTPIKTTSETVTGLVGGTALLAGAFMVAVPKIVETKKALDTVRIAGVSGTTALKGLGKVAGAATAIYAIAAAATLLGNSMRGAVPGVEATTKALLTSVDAGAMSTATIDGLFASIKSEIGPGTTHVDDLTSAFARLTDPHRIEGFTDKIGSMVGQVNSGTQSAEVFTNIGTALGKLVSSGYADQAKAQFDAMAKKLNLTGAETGQLMHLMPAYGEAIAGAANDAKMAAGKTDTLAGAQTDLATETQKAKDAIDAEVQALQDSGLVVLSTRAATRDFAQAQRDATAALKENGKSLKDGTVKGDANAAALDKMASSALGVADSIFKETGSEEKMRASLIASRASLVAMGIKFGMTKAQANAYADSIIHIPASKMTKVELDKAAAEAKAKALQAQINAIKQGKVPGVDANTAAGKAKIAALQKQINDLKSKTVTITTDYRRIGKPPVTGSGAATGGYMRGPGTTTSDSIPAMLSDKEYVVKAAAVSKYGVGTMDAINSMRFAAGGYVGPTATTAATSSFGNTVRLDKATIRALGREIATRPNVLDGQIMAASVDRRLAPR